MHPVPVSFREVTGYPRLQPARTGARGHRRRRRPPPGARRHATVRHVDIPPAGALDALEILPYDGPSTIAVAVGSLLLVTVSPGAPGAAHAPTVVLTMTLAIGFLPASIRCSSVLRTATVTTLTAATLPFTTPEQEQ